MGSGSSSAAERLETAVRGPPPGEVRLVAPASGAVPIDEWRRNVPEELRPKKAWVGWAPDPKTQRPKCPVLISAKARRASTRRSETWSSFDAASAFYGKYADGSTVGVGYVFAKEDGLVYVDVDDAVDERGDVREWALPFVEPFISRSYIELSPSGRGLHIIGKGKLPEGAGFGGKANFPQHATGAKVPEVALFAHGKYTTITGRVWKGHLKIGDVTEAAALAWERAGIRATGVDVKHGAAPEEHELPEPASLKVPKAVRRELDHCRAAEAEDRSAARFTLYVDAAKGGLEPEETFALVLGSGWYADSGAAEKGREHTWADVCRAYAKARTPAKEFEKGKPDESTRERLQALNKDYAVADEDGRMRVIAMKADPNFDGRERLVRYTFAAFREKLQPEQRTIPVGKGTTTEYVADSWLNWPGRRQYEGITFDPSGKAPADLFNMWRGWKVEPAAGNWSMLQDHILEVVCQGSRELYRYVVGWLAFLVQHPAERPETALVLRGKEGTGKSLFGQAVRALAGTHGFQVSNAKHLVGNFNAHLQNTLVLQADEAFFAGDRGHVSVLKSIITDPEIVIEGKGRDAILCRNRLHVVMTSNEDWVVPASLDARRFAMIDVSAKRKGDKAYFTELAAHVRKDATLAAMLFDLQRESLEDFDVREVPQTAALEDQKVRSLDGLQAWLVDVLMQGWLGKTEFAEHSAGPREWLPFYATDDLHDAYAQWMSTQRRHERLLPKNIFGKEMTKLFEPLRECRAADLRPGVRDGVRGYRFGTLAEARERFCAKTGLSVRVFGEEEAR
jgi:hypothetical protein